MGRRSINTTKSGKYMNPTDQARKEARKQELKKNKKQRQMVRAAVLKGKDPQQILEEMEKIDQMEYNVNQPSPLNDKVLKDKRKKLRDTLDRVLSMYHKDDPDKWAELKRKQVEYEHKRIQMIAFYESVKSAQQVQVDEIPLPQVPQQSPIVTPITTSTMSTTTTTTSTTNAPAAQIPLPIERKQEHTIYSIATALKLQALGQPVRDPPGCPPGPPPNITDDGEIEDYIAKINDDENKEESMNEIESTSKPTSVQQKMVALSGQNVDEFMKEMEVAHKKLEITTTTSTPTVVKTTITSSTSTTSETISTTTINQNETQTKMNDSIMPPGTADHILQQPHHQQQTTQNINPPLMFPSVTNLRLPPGPPPGRPLLPPGPPPGLPPPPPPPPRMPQIRLTSTTTAGPPPPPPRMIRLPPPGLPGAPPNLQLGTPNVLSAAPQLINRLEVGGISKQQGATITAKPQIRNLSADVTRFVPSALRIKREDKKSKVNTRALVQELKQKEYNFHHNSKQSAMLQQPQHTKDDAYKQFMEEMQNLL